ncbi:Hypothetical_protein [Hexamita inflata]|uniref:Hypothetical_protein n=1 Tax=Hexamita inflata TaxID=28002 RepID=A0AA86S5F0_9EUKA|nr:Hypothetical protein HINF_LOCUS65995 [Hexamita inflata]
MSVLMRRENTLIIEPGSDISKIQIINFILLPNSKKHFEGPPLYGFEFVGDKCYQMLNTEHGDCFQGEGRIVCTKCDSGYQLVKQVCKEDIDIIYIILGVICGFVILISAIVAVIASCQLKQYRKPQFLAFQPQILASDAAWQGKVVKAEKFGDLMRM